MQRSVRLSSTLPFCTSTNFYQLRLMHLYLDNILQSTKWEKNNTLSSLYRRIILCQTRPVCTSSTQIVFAVFCIFSTSKQEALTESANSSAGTFFIIRSKTTESYILYLWNGNDWTHVILTPICHGTCNDYRRNLHQCNKAMKAYIYTMSQ